MTPMDRLLAAVEVRRKADAEEKSYRPVVLDEALRIREERA